MDDLGPKSALGVYLARGHSMNKFEIFRLPGPHRKLMPGASFTGNLVVV